jgi:hypothetical protein
MLSYILIGSVVLIFIILFIINIILKINIKKIGYYDIIKEDINNDNYDIKCIMNELNSSKYELSKGIDSHDIKYIKDDLLDNNKLNDYNNDVINDIIKLNDEHNFDINKIIKNNKNINNKNINNNDNIVFNIKPQEQNNNLNINMQNKKMINKQLRQQQLMQQQQLLKQQELMQQQMMRTKQPNNNYNSDVFLEQKVKQLLKGSKTQEKKRKSMSDVQYTKDLLS